MYVGKTLFAQVMEFVPWTSFARIVQRHGGNTGVRTLTCAEQFRDLGKMLVLPFARQNFVADDDGAKGAAHTRSPSMVTTAPPRERRKASSP